MIRMDKSNRVKKELRIDSQIIHSAPDKLLLLLLFYVHGKHLRSCRDCQLT